MTPLTFPYNGKTYTVHTPAELLALLAWLQSGRAA